MNIDIPRADADELGFRTQMSSPEVAAYQAVQEQLETLMEKVDGNWQFIECDIEYSPDRRPRGERFEYKKDALNAIYNRSPARDIFSQIRVTVPLNPRDEFPIEVIGRHHAGGGGYYGYETLTTTELKQVEPLVVGLAQTMPTCPELHFDQPIDELVEDEAGV